MSTAEGESEKALRYLNQLDAARCNGHWDSIHELARKIEKHAPRRKTLVLTARAEADVALGDITSCKKMIPSLISTIEEDKKFPEDVFQASVCLAWIHWSLNEPKLAASRLPKDMAAGMGEAASKGCVSPQWIQVCASKGAYIKGFAQEKAGDASGALDCYNSMIPFLSSVSTLGSMSAEFRLWTDRLLSRLIAVSMKSEPLGELTNLDMMLRVFHLWSSLFNFCPIDAKNGVPQSSPPLVELGLEVEYSRWDVWMAYYKTLSDILRRGFIYSPSYATFDPHIVVSADEIPAEDFESARLLQRTELKSVEARIESKLLEETGFPKAKDRNERVERWVDAIMQNWAILCGPTWQDKELGEGGKNAISRGVLDSLYRAATKTFHSTQILRNLFSVHAYLAEFELAFKALDSYLEIVSHGKSRTAKTGEIDYSLDDGDKILTTTCEAISLLCRFGERKEGEKARGIGEKVLSWMPSFDQPSQLQESSTLVTNGVQAPQNQASLDTLALAYSTIGSCEAHWARITYDATSRTFHQAKAIEHFRKSLHPRLGRSKDLDTRLALAVVLAEMRDVPAAIKVIRQSIADCSANAEYLQSDDYACQRKLIRFWHLLTLLLSARSDLLNAAKASNAAFEQFQDPGILFGFNEYRSEHLNDNEPVSPSLGALVDRMDTFEKEGILQVKMTQICLLEALDGAAAAVDSSADLLALYVRLFNDPKAARGLQKSLVNPLRKAPKSAIGSIRTAIFKRSKSRARGEEGRASSTRPGTRGTIANKIRPSTAAPSVNAPTIEVTDESNGTPTRGRTENKKNRHSAIALRTLSRRSGVETPKRTASGKLHKENGSVRRKSEDSTRLRAVSQPPSVVTKADGVDRNGSLTTNGNGNAKQQAPPDSLRRVSSTESASSFVTADDAADPTTPTAPDKPSRPSFSSSQAPPKSRASIFSQYSTFTQATVQPPLYASSVMRTVPPVPFFPSLPERRHKMSILIEVWLFISGLYSRASIFDDAKSAIDEAAELASTLESEVARVKSSVKSFANRGWGGGRSIEELWGDIWAQRGVLSQSNSLPHEAIANYEQALSHFPDHPRAVIGLSALLLGIYARDIPPEPPEYSTGTLTSMPASPFSSRVSELGIPRNTINLSRPVVPVIRTTNSDTSNTFRVPASPQSPHFASASTSHADVLATSTASMPPALTPQDLQDIVQKPPPSCTEPDDDPELLNRLAARDRAYYLLSTLTRLGAGWDDAEAWMGLARAYELGGQLEKAKEVLWWVVELEDSRPLREWNVVGLV